MPKSCPVPAMICKVIRPRYPRRGKPRRTGGKRAMEGLGGYFGRPAFLGAFVLAANGNSFQSMSCQHQIKVSNAWYIACCRHYESVGCRFQKVLAQGAEGGLSQLLAIYPHLLCRRPKQTRAAVLQSSCKGPCSQ